MTSLPDKPFRDSLEHYKKTPPPQAWNKIESSLYKNKTRSIWISTAAAVIILMMASFILWHANESQITTPPLTVQESIETKIPNPSPQTESTPDPIAAPEIASELTTIPKSQKGTSSPKEISTVRENIASPATVLNEAPIDPSTPMVPVEQTAPAVETETSTEIASSSLRSNKIVYSSSEVNSRFLKKENANSPGIIHKAPETIQEKASTPIQKIIDIAANLKYEENALGELREMKNEILSLPRKEAIGDKK